MTLTTLLLPGVDKHGAGFRVRLRFRRLGVHTETGFRTADKANARSLELRELRAAGLEPDAAPEEPTIAVIGEALKLHKATRVSKKTGKKLRPASVEWWERIVDPWIDEHGAKRVSLMRRATVEDSIAEVALDAVNEANNRLVGIKAILRVAEARGVTVDKTIFALDEIPHTARERVALTGPELQFLVGHALWHGRPMLLFKGTVGNRWRELATWVDERFDAKARTMFVPAGLCKEGVDKTIDLTPAEVELAIENQLERAPGSRHIFPTATGMTWDGRYGDWHRDVWQKTVTRAAAAWRAEHDLGPLEATPFEWPLRDESDEPLLDEDGHQAMGRLKPHDLRATAITLMRDNGFTKEQVVARVGHADDGELIERIYDRGDRRARADVAGAIAALPGGGLLGGEDCRTVAPYNDRPALVSTVAA